MKITEVRVKMVGEDSERLRAFCSVTIDDSFVIRDLKVIDGDEGPFVAMPSRKMSDHCSKCGEKNHLRAKFCNECGTRLNSNRAPRDNAGRIKLYADVAHPINVESREMIQDAVIKAFNDELALSLEPGYSHNDEAFDEYDDEPIGFDDLIARLRNPKSTAEDADDSPASHRLDPGNSESKKSGRLNDRPRTDTPASAAASRRDARRTRQESTTPTASENRQRDKSIPAQAAPRTGRSVADVEGDDDDFAAGLDWSTPKPRTSSVGTDTPGNGRSRKESGKRQMDGDDLRRPAEEPAAGGAQEVERLTDDADGFGAGIL